MWATRWTRRRRSLRTRPLSVSWPTQQEKWQHKSPRLPNLRNMTLCLVVVRWHYNQVETEEPQTCCVWVWQLGIVAVSSRPRACWPYELEGQTACWLHTVCASRVCLSHIPHLATQQNVALGLDVHTRCNVRKIRAVSVAEFSLSVCVVISWFPSLFWHASLGEKMAGSLRFLSCDWLKRKKPIWRFSNFSSSHWRVLVVWAEHGSCCQPRICADFGVKILDSLSFLEDNLEFFEEKLGPWCYSALVNISIDLKGKGGEAATTKRAIAMAAKRGFQSLVLCVLCMQTGQVLPCSGSHSLPLHQNIPRGHPHRESFLTSNTTFWGEPSEMFRNLAI